MRNPSFIRPHFLATSGQSTMSRFIKSSIELSAARSSVRAGGTARTTPAGKTKRSGGGFTEAELAAAEWARTLAEVRANYVRPTNSEVRARGSSRTPLVAASQVPSVALMEEPRNESRDSKDKLSEEKRLRKDQKRAKKLEEKENKKLEHKKRKKEEKARKKANKIMRKVAKHVTDVCMSSPDVSPENVTSGNLRPEHIASIGDSMSDIDNLITTAKLQAAGLLTSECSSDWAKSANSVVDAASNVLVENAMDKNTRSTEFMQATKVGTKDQKHSMAVCVSNGAEEDNCSVHSDSSSSSSSALTVPVLTVPRDPQNPLEEAYNLKAYELLLQEQHARLKARRRHRHGPKWDHEPYLNRSPSPCRLRTDGAFYPTRKGTWRSRAGGIYLPPLASQKDGENISPSPSPARYLYPEEFKRWAPPQRRSPSYGPERRSRSRNSHARSLSRKSHARKRSHSRDSRTRSRSCKSQSRERTSRRRSPSYGPMKTTAEAGVCNNLHS